MMKGAVPDKVLTRTSLYISQTIFQPIATSQEWGLNTHAIFQKHTAETFSSESKRPHSPGSEHIIYVLKPVSRHLRHVCKRAVNPRS